jgi:ribosome-associated heat shock protein Hsp15
LTVRLDKWLWAVRVYKTRSVAASACRNGRVTIAGVPAKASREVKINDVILAQNGVMTHTVKVLGLVDRRVGAAVAKEFAEDLTPASEYEKLKQSMLPPLFHRLKGAGRPTKKDRRALGDIGQMF